MTSAMAVSRSLIASWPANIVCFSAVRLVVFLHEAFDSFGAVIDIAECACLCVAVREMMSVEQCYFLIC